MNIPDSVTIVTGASSGLGKACSAQLVERGGRVFGLARRKNRLEKVEKELGDLFTGIVCDVTDQGQVERAVRETVDNAGRIDVLVNNAGFGVFGNVEGLTAEDWDAQMATNLKGVFLCTRAVVPIMKRQNSGRGFGGHIVNIASVAGLIGNATIGAYNATKFGVRGFSEALMKELREDGIKVSCVYPGSIETEFFDVAQVGMSSNPMKVHDVAASIVHAIDTPENYLISEIVMRPLRPRGKS